MISLSTLTSDFNLELTQSGSSDVFKKMTIDSRRVNDETLFVACPGATRHSHDGHSFLGAAIQAGATGVVISPDYSEPLPKHVTVLRSSHLRRSAAQIAEYIVGCPTDDMNLIGITGTNGKTTVSFLVATLLEHLGERAAVFGTLGVGRPGQLKELGYTTPEAEVLSEECVYLNQQSNPYVALEVSSHALALSRVDGIRLKTAVFTNFSRDHLDYHLDMSSYFDAKARLFYELVDVDGLAIIPSDFSSVGYELVPEKIRCKRILTWGTDEKANIRGENIQSRDTKTTFTVAYGGEQFPVETTLLGEHNIHNLLVAAAVAIGFGHSLENVAEALSHARSAPGRFERVESNGAGARPLAIIDFAHTPDALANVLKVCRDLVKGHVWVVFGCGGDRDKGKRVEMGRVAAQYADVVILTNDNPRSEEPAAILKEIEHGVKDGGKLLWREGHETVNAYHSIEDREEAIGFAIRHANVEDLVLIAGKGHESTITIGDQKFSFVDAEIASGFLSQWEGAHVFS